MTSNDNPRALQASPMHSWRMDNDNHGHGHGSDPEWSPLRTAESIADALLAKRGARSGPWRWDVGVALVGLTDLIEVSPRARGRYLDHVVSFQGAHRGLRELSTPDHCVAAQTSVRVLQWTGDREAGVAVERVTRYLEAQRCNELGVFDHLGQRAWYRHALRRGAWVDSMMMYVRTAALIGAHHSRDSLLMMAREHAEAFCRHLQGDDGLFRHATLVPDRRHRVHWLRGNGWAAACLADLCLASPRLSAAYVREMNALLKWQGANGLWRTVIDDPTSPFETSGSALAAFALARGARLGVLAPHAGEAAWRAWKGLRPWLRRTRRGCTVGGISAPTVPAPGWMYRWIPRGSGLGYGIGAVLMLAAELALDSRRTPSS